MIETIDFTITKDFGATASATLRVFGSLRGSVAQWSQLLWLLHSSAKYDALYAVAEAIIAAAVPDEGEPHPRRAEVVMYTNNVVRFRTPGGASVAIYAVPEEDAKIGVRIDFHRASIVAASQVIAAITGERRHSTERLVCNMSDKRAVTIHY